jgi:hypothetical protein
MWMIWKGLVGGTAGDIHWWCFFDLENILVDDTPLQCVFANLLLLVTT